MSCYGCNLPLENTHILSTPCCATNFHTSCFIRDMPVAWYSTSVHIACTACLVMIRSNYIEPTTYPGPVEPAIPEYTESVRQLKKAVTAQRKAAREFQPVRVAHSKAFKAQSAPLITSLKTMKCEALTALKHTPEFRATVAAQRRTMAILKHIQNTFCLSGYLMETFGHTKDVWRLLPHRKILRSFRILL